MMNTRGLILFTILAAVVAGGCSETITDPSAVVGITWKLTSIQEGSSQGSGQATTVADPTRYTLRLTSEGRAEVKSDCNQCGGAYTLAEGSLLSGPLACTKVFCGDTSLDSKFVAALEASRSFRITDDDLVIESGNAVLKFRP